MSELHPLAPDVPHPSPQRGRVPAWLIVAALLMAPLVWGLQTLFSYGLTSMACFPSDVPRNATRVPGMSLIVLGGSVLALVLAVVALFAAVTAWRRTRGEHRGSRHHALDVGEGRTRFLALCGIIITGLFATAIVFEALVAIFLPHCFTAGQ